MTTADTLTDRAAAIWSRLTEAFPPEHGHGPLTVRLTRARKHQPRHITVTWTGYPFENTVHATLGDLARDDVTLDRRQFWSCGRTHPDAFDAWKAHEGAHHLAYDDDSCHGDYDVPEKRLPEDVEVALRAAGETLESTWCTPGNYVPCPTCGGGARIRDRRTMRLAPCPDCARLGIDQQTFPGILDLDQPAHRDSYEARLAQVRARAQAEANLRQAAIDQALADPAATAAPTWRRLPSRAGSVVAGVPVAPTDPDCDHGGGCRNPARWHDPNTGVRVCTRHATRP